MRINMSSRELRAALAPFETTASSLRAYWENQDKRVQLVALRAVIDTGDGLADELAHPEYDHARAVTLSRQLFDAGLALLDVIDEELAAKSDVDAGLRETRGAALTFMETVARYTSP